MALELLLFETNGANWIGCSPGRLAGQAQCREQPGKRGLSAFYIENLGSEFL